MKHWRLILVLLLLAVPIMLFVGIGLAAIWQSGLWPWLCWVLPVCWGIAYLLARRWRQQLVTLPGPAVQEPLYWTSRDKAAWELVQQRQRDVTELPRAQLADPHFYLQSAMDLSLEIARHYHPQAQDPLGSLTVPEILAAAQLALEDSATWVHDYVPGSRLLTVDQWRLLGKAPGWLKVASNATWAASILLNPVSLGRFLASKMTMDSASKQLQQNALAWFYAVFMRYAGFYLIEMNSGRLRGGAAKYRAVQKKLADRPLLLPSTPTPADPLSAPAARAAPVEVTLVLVGQANSGKSSLVNALLRERRAAVDVLPSTKRVARYRLDLDGASQRLILLDTMGYGADGVSRQELEELIRAAEHGDLILLATRATDPARFPDLNLLREVRSRIESSTLRKLPPVLAAVSHIDRLSPMLEWEPPYDWQHPSLAKEHSIAGAVQCVARELGAHVAGVVPVCTRENDVHGVYEELLPAIIALLDQAHACALLRNLHTDLSSGRIRQLVQQVANAGAGLLKSCLTDSDASIDAGS